MRKQFDFYGYCSPTSGRFTIGNDEYFYGEDYRNVKRYKEYKDVGFTMLLLQHENSYSGEEFSSSACCKCMTEGYKAGIDRIIVSDTRLKALCLEQSLVGEGCKFQTQEELVEYVRECMQPYANMPGFYGVQLEDEPECQFIDGYGKVVRAVKAVYPDAYVQANVLCIVEAKRLSPTETDAFKAYEEYLNRFTDATGQDCVQFDEYPFRRAYIIGGYSVRSYQIAARVAAERNIEFRAVMQSFSWLENGRIVHRRVNESDMYWQLNLAMGLGCKEYSFFTYFTKPIFSINDKIPSTDGVDGAAFINRDGSRTALYYYTRRIIKEMKKFAPVILPYTYESNYFFFEEGKTYKDFEQTEYAEINDGCPIEVQISKGVAFVTKLKKEGGEAYMVENLSNVKEELATGEIPLVTVRLPKAAKKATYYYLGKKRKAKLVDGAFQLSLPCGHAIYIIQ